ncbi:MAG: methyltransferase type 11 [Rhodospirillales bacterium]|nr:methyltransferase type 11 [Rhodospirillales bacterium]
MRIRAALAACFLFVGTAPVFAQYTHTAPSDDGIGIVYMGREIAHVMGHEGADWLERPERLTQEQPDRVIAAMELKPTDVVADIGAGTGYFSIRIARKVPQGSVIGEDIQPEMIDLMRENVTRASVGNVRPLLGSTEDPHLPAGTVDKVLLVDAYHEFDQPLEMMRGIVRGLKPNGQVVFVEYRGEDPAVPILPHHKMTVAQLSSEMAAVGLHLVRRYEELPWQHVLIYGR